MRTQLDPITLEVIRSSILTAVEEMKGTVVRTAYSTLWKLAGDVSCGLLTAACDVVSQGRGEMPVHLACMPFGVRACLEELGEGNLRPGDVLFQNDPYAGNNHLPDFLMAKPIFWENRIVAYSAVRGHYADIGGAAPGSYSATALDIYAEGLRIGPTLIYEQGEPNRDIIMVLQRNTRNARERLGDLRAQYAGCVIGERRILDLFRRYGVETMESAWSEILSRAERVMRNRIAALPKGVYSFTDFCDNDGAGGPSIEITLRLEVAGDRIIADFTGSSEQRPGSMNVPIGVTQGATCYAIKAALDPDTPANSGSSWPIEIIAPKGTVLNCLPPAAVTIGSTETSVRIYDVVLGALHQIVPENVVAAGAGTSGVLMLGGIDPRPERKGHEFVSLLIAGGAQGAACDQDGIHTTRVGIGNTGNQPVESLEINFPYRVELYEIAAGTGGAGRYRGGCGIRTRVRFEAPAVLTCASERGVTEPYGLDGGGPGARTYLKVVDRPDGKPVGMLPTKTVPEVFPAGTLLEFCCAGGGGYGDPLDRDLLRVLADVENEFISPEAARAQYGVVLVGGVRPVRWRIDPDATESLRLERKGGIA